MKYVFTKHLYNAVIWDLVPRIVMLWGYLSVGTLRESHLSLETVGCAPWKTNKRGYVCQLIVELIESKCGIQLRKLIVGYTENNA